MNLLTAVLSGAVWVLARLGLALLAALGAAARRGGESNARFVAIARKNFPQTILFVQKIKYLQL